MDKRRASLSDTDRERLTKAGKRLSVARAKVDAEMENAREIALDVMNPEDKNQLEVARLLGVDRMTVRKWAGKR